MSLKMQDTYTVQLHYNYALGPLVCVQESVNGGTTSSDALWLLNLVVELDLNYMQPWPTCVLHAPIWPWCVDGWRAIVACFHVKPQMHTTPVSNNTDLKRTKALSGYFSLSHVSSFYKRSYEIISAFATPPSREYLGYLTWRVVQDHIMIMSILERRGFVNQTKECSV